MKKIRAGFETNSSSAHSLVLPALGDDTPLSSIAELGYIDQANILYITGETEFGWQWEIWDHPGDKANYLYLTYQEHAEQIDRLKDIIQRNTGTYDVVFESIKNEKYPYIDHESMYIASDILGETDDNVWNFIMNPSAMVRGGNDNSTGPWETEN